MGNEDYLKVAIIRKGQEVDFSSSFSVAEDSNPVPAVAAVDRIARVLKSSFTWASFRDASNPKRPTPSFSCQEEHSAPVLARLRPPDLPSY